MGVRANNDHRDKVHEVVDCQHRVVDVQKVEKLENYKFKFYVLTFFRLVFGYWRDFTLVVILSWA